MSTAVGKWVPDIEGGRRPPPRASLPVRIACCPIMAPEVGVATVSQVAENSFFVQTARLW